MQKIIKFILGAACGVLVMGMGRPVMAQTQEAQTELALIDEYKNQNPDINRSTITGMVRTYQQPAQIEQAITRYQQNLQELQAQFPAVPTRVLEIFAYDYLDNLEQAKNDVVAYQNVYEQLVASFPQVDEAATGVVAMYNFGDMTQAEAEMAQIEPITNNVLGSYVVPKATAQVLAALNVPNPENVAQDAQTILNLVNSVKGEPDWLDFSREALSYLGSLNLGDKTKTIHNAVAVIDLVQELRKDSPNLNAVAGQLAAALNLEKGTKAPALEEVQEIIQIATDLQGQVGDLTNQAAQILAAANLDKVTNIIEQGQQVVQLAQNLQAAVSDLSNKASQVIAALKPGSLEEMTQTAQTFKDIYGELQRRFPSMDAAKLEDIALANMSSLDNAIAAAEEELGVGSNSDRYYVESNRSMITKYSTDSAGVTKLVRHLVYDGNQVYRAKQGYRSYFPFMWWTYSGAELDFSHASVPLMRNQNYAPERLNSAETYYGYRASKEYNAGTDQLTESSWLGTALSLPVMCATKTANLFYIKETCEVKREPSCEGLYYGATGREEIPNSTYTIRELMTEVTGKISDPVNGRMDFCRDLYTNKYQSEPDKIALRTAIENFSFELPTQYRTGYIVQVARICETASVGLCTLPFLYKCSEPLLGGYLQTIMMVVNIANMVSKLTTGAELIKGGLMGAITGGQTGLENLSFPVQMLIKYSPYILTVVGGGDFDLKMGLNLALNILGDFGTDMGMDPGQISGAMKTIQMIQRAALIVEAAENGDYLGLGIGLLGEIAYHLCEGKDTCDASEVGAMARKIQRAMLAYQRGDYVGIVDAFGIDYKGWLEEGLEGDAAKEAAKNEGLSDAEATLLDEAQYQLATGGTLTPGQQLVVDKHNQILADAATIKQEADAVTNEQGLLTEDEAVELDQLRRWRENDGVLSEGQALRLEELSRLAGEKLDPAAVNKFAVDAAANGWDDAMRTFAKVVTVYKAIKDENYWAAAEALGLPDMIVGVPDCMAAYSGGSQDETQRNDCLSKAKRNKEWLGIVVTGVQSGSWEGAIDAVLNYVLETMGANWTATERTLLSAVVGAIRTGSIDGVISALINEGLKNMDFGKGKCEALRNEPGYDFNEYYNCLDKAAENQRLMTQLANGITEGIRTNNWVGVAETLLNYAIEESGVELSATEERLFRGLVDVIANNGDWEQVVVGIVKDEINNMDFGEQECRDMYVRGGDQKPGYGACIETAQRNRRLTGQLVDGIEYGIRTNDWTGLANPILNYAIEESEVELSVTEERLFRVVVDVIANNGDWEQVVAEIVNIGLENVVSAGEDRCEERRNAQGSDQTARDAYDICMENVYNQNRYLTVIAGGIQEWSATGNWSGMASSLMGLVGAEYATTEEGRRVVDLLQAVINSDGNISGVLDVLKQDMIGLIDWDIEGKCEEFRGASFTDFDEYDDCVRFETAKAANMENALSDVIDGIGRGVDVGNWSGVYAGLTDLIGDGAGLTDGGKMMLDVVVSIADGGDIQGALPGVMDTILKDTNVPLAERMLVSQLLKAANGDIKNAVPGLVDYILDKTPDMDPEQKALFKSTVSLMMSGSLSSIPPEVLAMIAADEGGDLPKFIQVLAEVGSIFQQLNTDDYLSVSKAVLGKLALMSSGDFKTMLENVQHYVSIAGDVRNGNYASLTQELKDTIILDTLKKRVVDEGGTPEDARAETMTTIKALADVVTAIMAKDWKGLTLHLANQFAGSNIDNPENAMTQAGIYAGILEDLTKMKDAKDIPGVLSSSLQQLALTNVESTEGEEGAEKARRQALAMAEMIDALRGGYDGAEVAALTSDILNTLGLKNLARLDNTVDENGQVTEAGSQSNFLDKTGSDALEYVQLFKHLTRGYGKNVGAKVLKTLALGNLGLDEEGKDFYERAELYASKTSEIVNSLSNYNAIVAAGGELGLDQKQIQGIINLGLDAKSLIGVGNLGDMAGAVTQAAKVVEILDKHLPMSAYGLLGKDTLEMIAISSVNDPAGAQTQAVQLIQLVASKPELLGENGLDLDSLEERLEADIEDDEDLGECSPGLNCKWELIPDQVKVFPFKYPDIFSNKNFCNQYDENYPDNCIFSDQYTSEIEVDSQTFKYANILTEYYDPALNNKNFLQSLATQEQSRLATQGKRELFATAAVMTPTAGPQQTINCLNCGGGGGGGGGASGSTGGGSTVVDCGAKCNQECDYGQGCDSQEHNDCMTACEQENVNKSRSGTEAAPAETSDGSGTGEEAAAPYDSSLDGNRGGPIEEPVSSTEVNYAPPPKMDESCYSDCAAGCDVRFDGTNARGEYVDERRERIACKADCRISCDPGATTVSADAESSCKTMCMTSVMRTTASDEDTAANAYQECVTGGCGGNDVPEATSGAILRDALVKMINAAGTSAGLEGDWPGLDNIAAPAPFLQSQEVVTSAYNPVDVSATKSKFFNAFCVYWVPGTTHPPIFLPVFARARMSYFLVIPQGEETGEIERQLMGIFYDKETYEKFFEQDDRLQRRLLINNVGGGGVDLTMPGGGPISSIFTVQQSLYSKNQDLYLALAGCSSIDAYFRKDCGLSSPASRIDPAETDGFHQCDFDSSGMVGDGVGGGVEAECQRALDEGNGSTVCVKYNQCQNCQAGAMMDDCLTSLCGAGGCQGGARCTQNSHCASGTCASNACTPVVP